MATRRLIIGAHTEGIGDEPLLRGIRGVHALRPFIHELDVTDDASIREYIQTNGPFDQIIYSAGVAGLSWINVQRREALQRMMEINAFGAVMVAQAHREFFPDARVRYAVLVSDAAHTPMRGSIAYCMSKAAEEMAVRVMARELAPSWTVVGIAPGVVQDTGMTRQNDVAIPDFRRWSRQQALEYEMKSSVLGRRITKQEVAETIVFALEGPVALNGSILTINGGK